LKSASAAAKEAADAHRAATASAAETAAAASNALDDSKLAQQQQQQQQQQHVLETLQRDLVKQVRHAATYCNALQYTAAHCNTNSTRRYSMCMLPAPFLMKNAGILLLQHICVVHSLSSTRH